MTTTNKRPSRATLKLNNDNELGYTHRNSFIQLDWIRATGAEELKTMLDSLCASSKEQGLTSINFDDTICKDALEALLGYGFNEDYVDPVGNHSLRYYL